MGTRNQSVIRYPAVTLELVEVNTGRTGACLRFTGSNEITVSTGPNGLVNSPGEQRLLLTSLYSALGERFDDEINGEKIKDIAEKSEYKLFYATRKDKPFKDLKVMPSPFRLEDGYLRISKKHPNLSESQSADLS